MTKLFKVLGLAFAVLFSSNMIAANTVKVETAKGVVEVPLNPQKVVVLDVGVVDNLNLLGVYDRVGMPPQFNRVKALNLDLTGKVEAGTLFEPNFEAIAKYQPDLIIVATRSAKKLPELIKIAPTIDMSIDTNNFMETVKNRIIAYGQIFAKQEKAKQLVDGLDAKLTEIQKLSKNSGTGLFVLVNGNKLSTSGETSRFGWLYKYLGIKPAAQNISQDPHGQPISFEFIKEHNPDWLIVFDRFAAIGKEGPRADTVLDNAIIHDTKAWKNKHVVTVDHSIYLEVGGLTGITRNINTLIDAFNHK